jgi:DNA-directed RNA polymerase II subunit RPB2
MSVPFEPAPRIPALLDEEVVQDILRSEQVLNGPVKHHVNSMQKLLEQMLPAIILENRQTQTFSRRAAHVTEITNVHIGQPVGRTSGGFYDLLDPASARMTKHTFSVPIVINVRHSIYSNAPPSRSIGWETVDPRINDLHMQIASRQRRGLPWTDLQQQIADIKAAKAATIAGSSAAVPSSDASLPGANVAHDDATQQGLAASSSGGDGSQATAPSAAGARKRGGVGGGSSADATASAAAAAGSRVGSGGTSGGGEPATNATQGSGAVGRPRKRQQIMDAAPTNGKVPEGTWLLKEKREFQQIDHFHLPILVHDSHFIVKGTEKTVLVQKRPHGNRVFVNSANHAPFTWDVEIRAHHAEKFRSTSTMHILIQCGAHGSGILRAVVRVPYVDASIPLLVMCRLVGFADAEAAATCAATGGALPGSTPIEPGSKWDRTDIHAARQWILSLLKDDAHMHVDEDGQPYDFIAMTREQLLMWVADRGTSKRRAADTRARYLAHLTANEFLPQMGLDSFAMTISRKARLFAYGIYRGACTARGIQDEDDRDHAGDKQYDAVGVSIATMLRQGVRQFRRRTVIEIRRKCESEHPINIPSMYSVKKITENFNYAMTTGTWGTQRGGSSATGTAQMLQRQNTIATISHQRRVNTPLKRESKQVKPRQAHVSAYGNLCPAETPEGESCGLVEQMAQCVHFCEGYSSERLVQIVAGLLGQVLIPLDSTITRGEMAMLLPRVPACCTEPVTSRIAILEHSAEELAAVRAEEDALSAIIMRLDPDTLLRVIVNGILIGFVADGDEATRLLRQGRRRRILPFDVAIERMDGTGVLNVDGEISGMRRPLFVLDENASLAGVMDVWRRCRHGLPEDLWRTLELEGHIEYVSKHEEQQLLVLESPCSARGTLPAPYAPLRQHTHCELHPSVMLGAPTATIPLSEHNQSPRTTYYASMMKQTIANPGAHTPYTNCYRLWYTQHANVTTWAEETLIGMDQQPSGMNVLLAVIAESENQEDSVILNADSAARGLFACSVIKNHTEDCAMGYGADSEAIQKPPPYVDSHKDNPRVYDKLNAKGLVAPGTHLQAGDAFIGKTTKTNEILCSGRDTNLRCRSAVLSSRDHAMVVDSVMQCPGRDEKQITAVQMHTARFMHEGDKVTSRHGQKGVVGALRRAVSLPFAANGEVPDVIMNPHALPSRMTIGHLLEGLLGQLCGVTGETGDGTPFRDLDYADVEAELHRLGFSGLGHTWMYDGRTGERIATRLFMAPVYYLRVRQMVSDKAHARARGPTHILTGQPTEGRVKDGGLRMGEMEVRAVNGHGCAATLEDRLFQQSDYSEQPVCKECHLSAMSRAPPESRPYIVGKNELAGYCPNCGKAGAVFSVPMPYVAKLLCHELMAMHIRPEIMFQVGHGADVFTSAAAGIYRKDPATLPSAVARVPRVMMSRARGGPTRPTRAASRGPYPSRPPYSADNCMANAAPFPDARHARARITPAVHKRARAAVSLSGVDGDEGESRVTLCDENDGDGETLPAGFSNPQSFAARSTRSRRGDGMAYRYSQDHTRSATFGDSMYDPGCSSGIGNCADKCESSPPYTPGTPPYTPASPTYSCVTPPYTPASPTYTPASPVYTPASPTYTPASPVYTPASPTYTPASPVYTPASPAYTPASPVYMCISPTYSPGNTPACTTASPMSQVQSPQVPASEAAVARM